jgi:hypothetical protein
MMSTLPEENPVRSAPFILPSQDPVHVFSSFRHMPRYGRSANESQLFY